MRLLLDTHIWIWSYLEPQRLTPEVSKAIKRARNERFLSAVSVWEMLMLLERNRIQLKQDFAEWFRRSQDELMLREVPVDWSVAHAMRLTTLSHGDPADRLLVATAKVYGMTLVTADKRLMNISGLKVLANR